MADQSEIDLKIKEQTLIKKKKDVELQDLLMHNLELKNRRLRGSKDQNDPLSLSPGSSGPSA